MMQAPLNGGLAPVVVFGIEVQDPALVKKIKAVVIVSALLALWNIGYAAFWVIAAGAVVSGVGTILCAFCVPACGYFGAKNKNKELLCAFWSCNALSVCCGTTLIIVLLLVGTLFGSIIKLGFADSEACCKQLQACNFADSCVCTLPGDITMYPSTYSGCPGISDGSGDGMTGPVINHETNSTVACLSSDGCGTIDKLTTSGVGTAIKYGSLFTAVLMLPCILSCAACVLGFQLYNHPTFTQVVVVQQQQQQYVVAATTQPQYVQPGVAQAQVVADPYAAHRTGTGKF